VRREALLVRVQEQGAPLRRPSPNQWSRNDSPAGSQTSVASVTGRAARVSRLASSLAVIGPQDSARARMNHAGPGYLICDHYDLAVLSRSAGTAHGIRDVARARQLR
jgi:hypothetical protein